MIVYSEIGGHVLTPFFNMGEGDQLVAEKMLYYNRKMPIRINQWRVVPIEDGDR